MRTKQQAEAMKNKGKQIPKKDGSMMPSQAPPDSGGRI
jgi:hypothetical protein